MTKLSGLSAPTITHDLGSASTVYPPSEWLGYLQHFSFDVRMLCFMGGRPAGAPQEEGPCRVWGQERQDTGQWYEDG